MQIGKHAQKVVCVEGLQPHVKKSGKCCLSGLASSADEVQRSVLLSPRSGGSTNMTPIKTTKTVRVVPEKERLKIEKDFRDVLVSVWSSRKEERGRREKKSARVLTFLGQTQQGIPPAAQDKMVKTLDVDQQLEMIEQAARKQK
jgi:hypothetical protein